MWSKSNGIRSAAAPAKRNLIYHIYPVKNSIWRWNVDQISKHLNIFNGKKIIGIAIDDKTDDLRSVCELFDTSCEFIINKNNPYLGELNTFLPALQIVSSPSDIIFYAHAKGVTKGTKPVMAWAKAMYDINLASVSRIDKLIMNGYSAVGCFRIGEELKNWYFAGSFFWFVRGAVKGTIIERHYYGVEQFLRLHIQRDRSYDLFPIAKSLYDEEVLPSEYEHLLKTR